MNYDIWEGHLVCFNSKESNGRATEGGEDDDNHSVLDEHNHIVFNSMILISPTAKITSVPNAINILSESSSQLIRVTLEAC